VAAKLIVRAICGWRRVYRSEGWGGSRTARRAKLERFAAGDELLSVGGVGWESGAAARRATLRAICGWRRATICRRGGIWAARRGEQNLERFAAGDQQLSAGGEGRDSGAAGEA